MQVSTDTKRVATTPISIPGHKPIHKPTNVKYSTVISSSAPSPSIHIGIQTIFSMREEELKNRRASCPLIGPPPSIVFTKELKERCQSIVKECTKLKVPTKDKKLLKSTLDGLRIQLQAKDGFDEASFEIAYAYLHALYTIPMYINAAEGHAPEVKLVKRPNFAFGKAEFLIAEYVAKGKVKEYLDEAMEILPQEIREDLADNIGSFLMYDPKANPKTLKDAVGGLIQNICKYALRPSAQQLFAAALSGNLEMLTKCGKAFSERAKNFANPAGMTPFLISLINGNKSCLDYFLENGWIANGVKILGLLPFVTSQEVTDWISKNRLVNPEDMEKRDKHLRKQNEFNLLRDESAQVVLKPHRVSANPQYAYDARYVFKDTSAIIATSPTNHSQNNFWEMIVRTKTRTIVMLTDVKEHGPVGEVCSRYWPEVGRSCQYENNWVVDYADEVVPNTGRTIVKRTFDVVDLGKVTQFQVMNGPAMGLMSKDTLATLVRLVAGNTIQHAVAKMASHESEEKMSRILVHGSDKSGYNEVFMTAYKAMLEGAAGNRDANLVYNVCVDVNRSSGEYVKTLEQLDLIRDAVETIFAGQKSLSEAVEPSAPPAYSAKGV